LEKIINNTFMKYILFAVIIISILSCSSERTCKDLKEGTFTYTHPEHFHIRIIRERNKQIEINEETKIEAHTEVTWLNDCEYQLVYKEFKNAPEEFDVLLGDTILAKIIKIHGNKYTCSVRSGESQEKMDFKILNE